MRAAEAASHGGASQPEEERVGTEANAAHVQDYGSDDGRIQDEGVRPLRALSLTVGVTRSRKLSLSF